MKDDEPANPVRISLLRPYRVMTQPDRVPHLVEEFRFARSRYTS